MHHTSGIPSGTTASYARRASYIRSLTQLSAIPIVFTASTASPVAGRPESASLTASTMWSYVTATRGTSNSETAGKGGVESARVPAREKRGCRAPADRRSARVRSGAMAIEDPLLRPLPAATPAFGRGWSRATTLGLVLVGAPRAGDRDDRANQQLDVAPE